MSKHYALRQQIRNAAVGIVPDQWHSQSLTVSDLLTLLDYIDELEAECYATREDRMGEDL